MKATIILPALARWIRTADKKPTSKTASRHRNTRTVMKSLPTRQLRRQLRAYRRVNAALCLAALDASISSPVARRAARQPTGHL